MTQWPGPQPLDLGTSLEAVFGLAARPDAWAQATVLDVVRHNQSLTIDELFGQHPAFGRFAGAGSEWVALAFLAGGLLLLQRKVFSWHAPVAMLGSLFFMSLLGWNGSGSDSNGSPLFHLLAGSSLFVAFFIVTEPVSGPRAASARLLFGAGVGVLVYVIRTWGSYPDGSAFAVPGHRLRHWLGAVERRAYQPGCSAAQGQEPAERAAGRALRQPAAATPPRTARTDPGP
jgi:electron transport complex protein RnfD